MSPIRTQAVTTSFSRKLASALWWVGGSVRCTVCAPGHSGCGSRPQIGLGVRVFLPDTNTAANLWSVTNISIPLSRTSVSTITSLANYEVVFYGPLKRGGSERVATHRTPFSSRSR